MRADNLIVVALGLAALAFALVAIARWGSLPIHAPPVAGAGPEGSAAPAPKAAFTEAAWSLTSVLAASALSGTVIAGLFARAIMRVAGGVSPIDAQGRLTEADETVGEITFGGTMAIVVFVGLAGAIVATGLYLLSRPWLPETARAAGAMVGLIVMGIVGPGDPLDPDNIDFELLSYDSLTIALIILGSVVFGMAFVSIAAKFAIAARGGSPWRWAQLLGLVILTLVPLLAVAVVYVGGRTLAPGKLRAILERRGVQVVGRVILMLAVAASIARLAVVAIDILTG